MKTTFIFMALLCANLGFGQGPSQPKNFPKIETADVSSSEPELNSLAAMFLEKSEEIKAEMDSIDRIPDDALVNLKAKELKIAITKEVFERLRLGDQQNFFAMQAEKYSTDTSANYATAKQSLLFQLEQVEDEIRLQENLQKELSGKRGSKVKRAKRSAQIETQILIKVKQNYQDVLLLCLDKTEE